MGEQRTFVHLAVDKGEEARKAYEDGLEDRARYLRGLINRAVDDAGQEGSLGRETLAWMLRSYPVLAVLAPVMASYEGKIEFPGDPMCLASAISYAVDQVVQAKVIGLGPQSPYNDLCPRLGILPSRDYRFSVGDSGIRDYSSLPLNTDQTIFDPRIWNPEVKKYFVEHVLTSVQPKVVLISTVSPGHRYAIDIARTVRHHLPGTLIVLGGRHVDETMHFREDIHELEATYSSTLRAIRDGRIEPIVDFLISGDGYYALDIVMKAISLAMDVRQQSTNVPAVVRVMDELIQAGTSVRGQAIVVAIDGPDTHVFPLRGLHVDLAALPSPYRAVAIRARFPIFRASDGRVQRTAHVMVTNACPYHCNFCSEGRTVVGRLHRFSGSRSIDQAQALLARVLEYVSYGAEAMFFDDSVFCGGNIKLMKDFCIALSKVRDGIATGQSEHLPWLVDASDHERLAALQWGCQLTAEFLTTLSSRAEALDLLSFLQRAGCTYVYIGIESLAASIMNRVHKNIMKPDRPAWAEKVRAALDIAREAKIRVGSSVLFGLDGETRQTIQETIEGVAQLIADGLLDIASPNILTYHPGTEITRLHGMEDVLDYHTLSLANRPPYLYFEEAFPAVVSKELSEEDIWYIHHATQELWGRKRNLNPMKPTNLPTDANPTGAQKAAARPRKPGRHIPQEVRDE